MKKIPSDIRRFPFINHSTSSEFKVEPQTFVKHEKCLTAPLAYTRMVNQ